MSLPSSLKLPNIDYSSRDYVAIRDDLIAFIQFFCEEWTDHNPTDFGIVLIELFAAMGDQLHYYIDRSLNEGYLPTARARESVISLLELIGYQMVSAVPSKTTLQFTIPVQGSPTTIPKGFQVQTTTALSAAGTPIVFETDVAVTIPTGQTTATVSATQGKTQLYSSISGDGSAFQSYLIPLTPVIDGTVVATISAEVWTRVDSLFGTGANPIDGASQVYLLRRNKDDQVTIVFGDGVQGKAPPQASSISVTARLGGGADTNVGVGLITALVTAPIVGGMTVTNTVAATGGADRQSIEAAKVQGPSNLKTVDRAVTLADYETLAKNVQGVAKARALVEAVITVTMYIAPSAGGVATSGLLNSVKSYLDARRMITDSLIAKTALYESVDLGVDVHIFSNYYNADVLAACTAAWVSFMSFNNRNFGGDNRFDSNVRLSDVTGLFENITGVDFVDVIRLTLQPVPDLKIWTTDGATFSVIEVLALSVDETWTIKFTSPTAFTLTGSSSGTFSGTIGALVTTPQIRFTLTAGTAPMTIGDTATFRTSQLVGNVEVSQNAIAQKGNTTISVSGGL